MRRGQTLVEATLVLLIFFALLLGVMDVAQVLFAHQSLVARVSSAVRWGAVHPWTGPEPIRNMVLYDRADEPRQATQGYLGLKPENVRVTYYPATPERPDDERLTVAIVNFESHFYSPWIARTLISSRPVLVSAPVAFSEQPAAK